MRARAANIQTILTRSTEPIDFEAWAAQYVRAVLAADRARATHREAA
jgi:hypothetical protein